MSVPSQALPGWLGQWQPRLDAVGALASGLCAAHCVLVPLAIALMPYAGWQALESTAFDIGFVVFATLFGAIVLGAGTCRHLLRWTAPMYVVGSKNPSSGTAVGVICPPASVSTDDGWKFGASWVEQVATVLGLLGVGLTIRQSLWNFPVGLV